MGKEIATVNGSVHADSLGIMLPHEHVFINLINQFKEPVDREKLALSREAISLSNFGFLRRNPYAIRDNVVLDDLDLAVEELSWFKKLGGQSLVDCTSIGIGRSPEKLRSAAKRSGLNIVAGCGYYTADTHPVDMEGRSMETIADEMERDLTAGIGNTGVRAGVIGEIGTSDPFILTN